MSEVFPPYPAEVQTLWTALHKEVVWLHGRWIIYRQLYGTSSERVKLLNESAGTFFNILQNTLLHDVQLSLSKIGDPAGKGKNKNLTLDALIEQLRALGEDVIADKLDPIVANFATACSKLRNRRNKWIAHFDLATMTSQTTSSRMGPSRTEIEEALAALRDAMNCVDLHYRDTQTMYEHFAMQSDGEALIYSLMRGRRYKELVANGAIPKTDFRTRFKDPV